MRTLSENFEGFSQILKEQADEKRYWGVFTTPIAVIKNIIMSVSKEKFAIEYRKQKSLRNRFCLFSYGAHVKSFKQKRKVRKSLDTVL